MSSTQNRGSAPRWVSLENAVRVFSSCTESVQSQKHIRGFHWYAACRLVVGGGFRPEHVTPRPPFRVERTGGELLLMHDASAAAAGEHTLFGGLKTKDVDVVACIPGIGPVVAISMKGSLNAFRNLTNRMEEAAGDCTNIHMAYPGLVYAFWHIFRGNRAGKAPADTPSIFQLDRGRFRSSDVAVQEDGSLSSYLVRYFLAIERLSGRPDMRADPSAYETVGITLTDESQGCSGKVVQAHPGDGSPLHYGSMFGRIYRIYDLRFVYQSPALKGATRRLIWSDRSPALQGAPRLDYSPRVGETEPEDDDSAG